MPARSTWWLLLVLAVVLAYLYYSGKGANRSEISYGMFRHQLEAENNIEAVNIEGAKVLRRVQDGRRSIPTPSRGRTAAIRSLEKKFVTTLPPMALADPSLDQRAARAAEAGLQGRRAGRQHRSCADAVLSADHGGRCSSACGSCSARPAIRSSPAA